MVCTVVSWRVQAENEGAVLATVAVLEVTGVPVALPSFGVQIT